MKPKSKENLMNICEHDIWGKIFLRLIPKPNAQLGTWFLLTLYRKNIQIGKLIKKELILLICLELSLMTFKINPVHRGEGKRGK